MSKVQILVLVIAIYKTVCCEGNSAFGYELISTEIEQLRENQRSVQQQLELTNKQLQEQLELAKEESFMLKNQLQSLNEKLQRLELHALQQSNQEEFSAGLLSGKYRWVQWSADESIPEGAVFAGMADGHGKLYVARIRHNGEYFAAKASNTDDKCYLAYENKEIEYRQCEVLTGSNFSWKKSDANTLPDNAFPCGMKNNAEPLFIGRIQHNKDQIPGTINQREKSLSIPFSCEEIKYFQSNGTFDVLVMN